MNKELTYYVSLVLAFSSLLIVSCSDKAKQSFGGTYAADNEVVLSEGQSLEEEGETAVESIPFYPSTVRKKNIEYYADVMSALDFIERKGEKVQPSDLNRLSSEVVLLLRYTDLSSKKILESSDLKMGKTATLQYMAGEMQFDLVLVQGAKKISCSGVQLETLATEGARLRVMAFFSDVDLEEPVTIKMNDKLFGAGEILHKGIIKQKIN